MAIDRLVLFVSRSGFARMHPSEFASIPEWAAAIPMDILPEKMRDYRTPSTPTYECAVRFWPMIQPLLQYGMYTAGLSPTFGYLGEIDTQMQSPLEVDRGQPDMQWQLIGIEPRRKLSNQGRSPLIQGQEGAPY